jgi:hypothetical protein
MRRHSLLMAREGMALPDAVVSRDGDELAISWFPDPSGAQTGRVRFLGSGFARVPCEEFRTSAWNLIETTVRRLVEVVGVEDQDVARLAGLWNEIKRADSAEVRTCRSLAMLGVNPYDPDEADDVLVSQVEALEGTFPEGLRNDLLAASQPGNLGKAVAWLTTQEDARFGNDIGASTKLREASWHPSAHQTGYELARRARSELLGVSPQEPLADFEGILVERLGWDPHPLRERDGTDALEGLVGEGGSGRPVLVQSGRRSGAAARFRLARAAFFTTTGTLQQGRLITRSADREQRAGRAFAAELLAPSAAIAEHVHGAVDSERIDELAVAFGVSTMVIEHQIENHGLGFVVT